MIEMDFVAIFKYGPRLILLSHWPHLATHVATQVGAHLASLKGLGNKSAHVASVKAL